MFGVAQAKSVYVITDRDSTVRAYDIQDDQIEHQTNAKNLADNGTGAVGLALNPDSETLFVTYEGSNIIEMVNAKTMISEQNPVTVPGTIANGLSGIAFDQTNQKLYVMKRQDNKLYVYLWNPAAKTLNLEGGAYKTLENIGTYPNGAYGIALDENNNRLYVTDSTKTVRYYDTTNWEYQGSIDIVVDSNDREAVGIALDPNRRYLYTGAFTGVSGQHNFLIRTDINNPSFAEKNVGANIIGITADQDTGLVYITTSNDHIEVYNTATFPSDPCHTETTDISGPAGIVLAGDVSYKSPDFYLVKDNNDPNDDCVYPYSENYLIFDICWDANGHADTEVVIVDYLPKECDYYSSEPSGDYNSTEHTVTWSLEDISDSDSNCLQLKTKANYWAKPGHIFTNVVVMEGDTYLNETTCDVNVCNWGTEIIYVDEDANGFNNGTSWDDAYNYLQDAFTGARNSGATVIAIWVAAGTYKPVWDTGDDNSYKNESFELVENVGVFGHFGGVGTYETSTSQRNFADANNETILEGQIGQIISDAVYDIITADGIGDAIVDGFTIQGSYFGSGIFLNSSDVSIVNCILKNNYYYGIECYNFSYPDIHNCTFIDNSTYGLYAYLSCRPEVSNCVFDGNDTTSEGIHMLTNTNMLVDDCVFKDHTSKGIYGSGGKLTVTDSNFENNNSYGLGLSNVMDLTITNCSIWGSNYGIYASYCNPLTITNCSIKSSNHGIHASYCNPLTITNCSIKSSNYGIHAQQSGLTVDHSVIAHSTRNGLYMENGCILTLKHSVVRHSGEHGINLNNNVETTIKNNWIHNNGTDQYASDGAGVYSGNHTSETLLVRNNTIYRNRTYGIESSEQGADPNVLNCIVYGNDSNDFYRENGTFDTVNYCSLQHSHAGTGNITGDPGFRNPDDPNDLHLGKTSKCIDAGDPEFIPDPNETDIDGEDRVIDGDNNGTQIVDMGADECYWSPADFDESENVDFVDYAMFANAWQTTPADDDYNDIFDINDNSSIDYNDLRLFVEDWLWTPVWTIPMEQMMMGGSGGYRLDGGHLMLLDAKASLKARPERLITKSQKFYDITQATIVKYQPAEKIEPQPELEPQPDPEPEPQPQLTEVDIQKLVRWLEELWLTDEQVRESFSEDEWQKFIESVEEGI